MELPTLPYDLDDELLARTRDDGQPRIRVYRCEETAVVIGRGGRQQLELHTAAIAADQVPLYRRLGGGCSVVLDPGNLIVSVVLPLPGIGQITSAFAAISDYLIAALGQCGVPNVVQRGVSDLVIGDRKVGGSCVYRTRGLLYYSTTLLCEQDMTLVDRYLLHPPREPEYRQGRPHGSFMGSLREIYGISLSDGFTVRLNSQLQNGLRDLSKIRDN